VVVGTIVVEEADIAAEKVVDDAVVKVEEVVLFCTVADVVIAVGVSNIVLVKAVNAVVVCSPVEVGKLVDEDVDVDNSIVVGNIVLIEAVVTKDDAVIV
jgi:hypothetical protein